MALAKDLSALAASERGIAPDQTPGITPALIKHWAALDDRDRAMAHPEARIRHSWSGKCSRAIAYLVGGEQPTNPFTEADYYRFAIGKIVHEFWQQFAIPALTEVGWTDLTAEYEMTTSDTAGRIVSAGHGDLIGTTPDGKRTKVEVKTINGFGYKSILGLGKDPAGPRWGDLLQGSVNADASDCDELRMVYLSLELLSPSYANKVQAHEFNRFCAEWTFTREQWFPLAQVERERWDSILASVDAEIPVPRYIPDPDIPVDAIIVDPKSGRWDVTDDNGYITNSGSTWHCNYCSFRHKCQIDS